jgi:sec-independent protein translocase protein TatA
MSGLFSPSHLLLIGIVVLVLFGRGKVSSMMGEVGKGITAFRKGLDEGRREVEASPLILSSQATPSEVVADAAPEAARG